MAPAIKHLQEAMRNDPDNSSYRTEIKKWRSMEAQKEAGNLAFKQGRMDEAIDKWTECLGMDPSHRRLGTLQGLEEYGHAKNCRHVFKLLGTGVFLSASVYGPHPQMGF